MRIRDSVAGPQYMGIAIGSSGQDIDWVSSWDAAKMVTGREAQVAAVIK